MCSKMMLRLLLIGLYCVMNLFQLGSGNLLSPLRYQTNTYTNAGILPIGIL